MAIWASILLILAGLYRFPSEPLRLMFQLLVETAVILALVYVLWRRVNSWAALFLLLALVSLMYPKYDRFAFMAFHSVLFGILWLTMIVLYVRPGEIGILMDAICILAVFQAVYAMFQFFGLDPLFKPIGGGRTVTGLMSNRNELGALLAFSFPAFLRPGRRWGLIPLFLGIILSRTSLAIVAVAAGWLFYQSVRGHFFLSLFAGLAGISFYFFFIDTPAASVRWEAWGKGLSLYGDRWVMGHGLGHWKTTFPMIHRQRWVTAHNEFLQGLFEMGLGFVFVVAGYLVNVVRRLPLNGVRPWRRRTPLGMTALVVIAVVSMAGFPFHNAITAMVALTWLAVLELQLKEKSNHEKISFA